MTFRYSVIFALKYFFIRNSDIEVVAEGSERNDFWSEIGGKTRYQTTIDLDAKNQQLEDYDGRLFECSNGWSIHKRCKIIIWKQDINITTLCVRKIHR